MLDRDEKPIKIGRLQRYATDALWEKGVNPFPKKVKPNGKKVALVGSGPASLGCAAELARLGYATTVFEKDAEPGGLNRYGIAYYKMPPAVAQQEVKWVKDLGVEFRTNTEIGKDVPMEKLLEDYDAVFLGMGLGRTHRLGIPGEDRAGVVEALEFIRWIHTKPLHEVPVGERVAVLGCGNTAIDAVTQAKRLGAKEAVIIYRRGEGDMTAYPYEYELAKKDGCSFLFHTAPVEVLGEKQVTGLRLIRTQVGADGKATTVAGSEFTEPFDMVIMALGQEKQASLWQKLLPRLKFDSAGRLECNPATGQTSMPKVFAGGDAVSGGREVVNAVAEGKKAAHGMHALLCGKPVNGPIQASRLGHRDGAKGSGFLRPVRVPELEAAYKKERNAKSHG